MSESARAAQSTPKLAACALAALIGLAGIGGGISYGLLHQASYEQDARREAFDYAKHATEKKQHACRIIAKAERKTCLTEAHAEYELDTSRNRHDAADLAAQRQSALWAGITGLTALVGIALSAVGIGLVWITFREQRRTNNLAHEEADRARVEAADNGRLALEALATAQRNADAVARQVEVAEATARLQLRAYLAIGRIRLKRTPNDDGDDVISFNSKIWIANVGATPALNVRIRYDRFAGENADPTPIWIQDRQWILVPTIPQGARNHMEDFTTIKRSIVSGLKNRSSFCYIILQLAYEDVYGSKYLHSCVFIMDIERCCWDAISVTEEQLI
jgi:hypothetical protein